MHKKLEAELVSLAHQILQMKDKDDVIKLKNIAKKLHEKLSILTFVDNYFLTTPNASEDKQEIFAAIEDLDSLENKHSEEKLGIKTEVVEETIATNNDTKDSIVEELPVEELIVEEAIVTNNFNEELIVEELPAEEPIVEEAIVTNNFNEEPIVEELPVEEPIVEEAIVTNNFNEELIVEKPIVEEQVDVTPSTISEISNELETSTAEIIKTEADQIVDKIITQEVTDFKTEKEPVSEPEVETANTSASLANNEEFKNSIPADVAANLFEKASTLVKEDSKDKTPTTEEIQKMNTEVNQPNVATKVETIPTPKPVSKTKASVNDRVFNQKLQIGLNDRIAFVKHLFNYSQEDFNRVLSQLNTFETEVESKDFINAQIKPEYNWSGKEEYEERLIALIERKFV